MPTDGESVRRRVLISGRVQGVGFRWSCKRVADSLGVSGWCRNRPDGRVEAVFEGDPKAVRQMVAWSRGGPPSAIVTSVDAVPETPEGLRGFGLG